MHAKFLSLAAIATLIAGCSRSPRPAAPPSPLSAPAAPVVLVPAAEIGRVAERVFLDSATVNLSAGSEDAEDGRPTYDIDVRSYETHARVEHYVTMFTRSGARAEFTEWLERGTRYDAMIRSKLRAGGIPEDMTYLALVESGYDPQRLLARRRGGHVAVHDVHRARPRSARGLVGGRASRSGALDRRRHPPHPLAAEAVRLALPGGRGVQRRRGSRLARPHAVRRRDARAPRATTASSRSPRRTTCTRRRRTTCRRSSPRRIVAKEPAKYGIVVRPRAPLAYDSVPVPAATPLAAVAKAAGVSLAEIIDLNPQMLRGMTPPASSYTLRVPVGRADLFADALAALPPADREAFRRTESKTGESLRAVAERMDASAGAIATFNADLKTVAKGKHRGKLRAGQSVRVPTPALLAGMRDVPDPSIERRASARPAPKAATVTTVRHVVKRGESLGTIARKYDTSVGALRSLNGMKASSVIKVGKSLVVRRSAAADARLQADADEEDAEPKAKSGARSKAGATSGAKVKAGSKPKASTKTKAAAKKSTAKSSAKSGAKSATKAKSTASGSKSSKSAKGKPATNGTARTKSAAKSKAVTTESATKKRTAKKPAAKSVKAK